MGDTTATVIMIIFGAAVMAYGVLLMVFAITGAGFAKKLKPVNRARLGCSAAMIILIGLWLVTLNFTE